LRETIALEKSMTKTAFFALTFTAAAFLMPGVTPARADFFDGARKTFETDIPHFFQDDIPCAFGGQPTSHTKSSCNAPSRPAARAPEPRPMTEPAPVRTDDPVEIQQAPPPPGTAR
jgi:hypothetical protein